MVYVGAIYHPKKKELMTPEEQVVNEANEQIKSLESKLEHEQTTIENLKTEIKSLNLALAMAEDDYITKSGQDKKDAKATRDLVKNQIKTQKAKLSNSEEMVEMYERQLVTLKRGINTVFTVDNNETSSARVFEENNIHYVIHGRKWWSVDAAGDRMNIKIESSDFQTIKDLIFLDSDWEIKEEQELKRQAKSKGRMFKHIVRDFGRERAGVYNQMNDIRKNWLQPIFGEDPHYAFRLLFLSIAGGDEEYADQLEKMIAYRYVHPEDVMVPSVDSCGIGGTGRETYYNIIRTIFTGQCCATLGGETFTGTHNGDLFGIMFGKIDEKDGFSIPIDPLKEMLGGIEYRHRAMGENARTITRLFTFLMFRNGYTTTARLAGTGSSGEDRRFEPVIARVNLPRHFAKHHQLIDDLNTILDDEQTKAMSIIIKEIQKEVYKDERHIAVALGHWITKYRVSDMTELLPLHGKYYQEMVSRQKKGIEVFMPKMMATMKNSTVISLKDTHKIYELVESHKISKESFKNKVLYWLQTHLGWDAECITDNIYTGKFCSADDRRQFMVFQNRLAPPPKLVFDIDDFIDADALDDKGISVGQKINLFSIRDTLK
jgi:superoxide dismutase